ncbi:MAG TPA: hypothetical protein DCR51_00540 [Idiomarina loihiensis]|nr:hypothetical protein [Idiomarina loihiensis]|tara:strand:+ start:276 stop:839 length:564 start_codon:yes stop_codon:yes gene_type:complete
MPLAFPNVGIKNMSMRLKRVTSTQTSPFTLDTQVALHPGARWEAEISLPLRNHAEARSIEGFIVGLKGQSGTFTFGNPLHTSSLSNGRVSSAAVRAETFELTLGAASAIPLGTYFELLGYLYCVTEDKAANEATLNFQPPLRLAVTSAQPIKYNLPKSLWRMASDDVGWSISEASVYGFTFACVEAL